MTIEDFKKHGLCDDDLETLEQLREQASRGHDNFDSFDCDYSIIQERLDIDIHPFVYSYQVTCPECGGHELAKRKIDWHPLVAHCANHLCGAIVTSPVPRQRPYHYENGYLKRNDSKEPSP